MAIGVFSIDLLFVLFAMIIRENLIHFYRLRSLRMTKTCCYINSNMVEPHKNTKYYLIHSLRFYPLLSNYLRN